MTETSLPTCGSCRYLELYHGEHRGPCHANPPTVFSSGDQKWPIVKDHFPACHHYEPGTPQVKEKVRPETPGDAAKAAHVAQVAAVATPEHYPMPEGTRPALQLSPAPALPTQAPADPAKRGRGRPRKYPVPTVAGVPL